MIEGSRSPRISVAAADSFDNLEIWVAELEGGYVPSGTEYVDASLSYASRPLRRHGSWVSTSHGHGWRPRVAVSWRPFTDGWWAYTPSGLTWVAAEPWGWVTSHYGIWDYRPVHGWVWYPGLTYSPAWVYWYWGPAHVAWVPAGLYANFYSGHGSFGFGFHYGVYGWAGGGWDGYRHWTFCPTRYFGRRSHRAYWRSGHEIGHQGRYRAVPRGVITTDTRDIGPGSGGSRTRSWRVCARSARLEAARRLAVVCRTSAPSSAGRPICPRRWSRPLSADPPSDPQALPPPCPARGRGRQESLPGRSSGRRASLPRCRGRTRGPSRSAVTGVRVVASSRRSGRHRRRR